MLGWDFVSCLEKEVFLCTPRLLDDALDVIPNCPPCTVQPGVKFIVNAGTLQIQQARFGLDPKQLPADSRATIRMFSNIVAAVSETREIFLDN